MEVTVATAPTAISMVFIFGVPALLSVTLMTAVVAPSAFDGRVPVILPSAETLSHVGPLSLLNA